MGMFGHNGWLGGKHSLGGKFSSGFGGFLNDITGQSSSAKQQYKQQLALQHDAQDFSKWQMANAHQMEVQDLQKAGLNPILSANAGASAGVTEGGTTGGTPSADPIAMAGAIVSMINSTKKTKADIKNETNLTNAQVKNLGATTKNIDANTTKTTTTTTKDKVIEQLYKIPVIKHILGFGSEFFGGNPGGAAATAVGAKAVSKGMNKPKTTVTNHYNSKGKLTGSTTTTSRK